MVGAPPSNKEGAGKAGCSAAPAAWHAKNKCVPAVVATGSTEEHPAFPAQWRNGLLRASPGDLFIAVGMRMVATGRPG